MLDVAAVALAWLEKTCPRVPGLSESAWPALAALIALHDVGKFSRPFQAKRSDLWPAALGDWHPYPAEPRHDSAGYTLLCSTPVADALLPRWRPTLRNILLRGLGGNHARPPREETDLDSRLICPTCVAAAQDFAATSAALIAPSPVPPLKEPAVKALGWWLAGLVVLADWIGSNETWFPYSPNTRNLAGYWQAARSRAEVAVAAAGIIPAAPRLPPSLAAVLPEAATPSPMQSLASEVALGPAEAPALVFIEDQMGSGKSEAALHLAHRLIAEKGNHGLYLALPTTATADALYDRLALPEAQPPYTRLFAADAHPSLVLAHGRRRLNDRFAAAVERSGSQIQGRVDDDDADEPAELQCAEWIAEDRRRTFLAECGVGTIDQALQAVLPTRHAPLRLHGLAARVLVIDEAHAYDGYEQEELFRLVEFQTRLGGSTVVLSATLPEKVRGRLIDIYRGARDCPAPSSLSRDYPLLTAVTADGIAQHRCPPRDDLSRRIAVARITTVEAAVERIAHAAARGAAVAWIRNTVDDAAEAHALLLARSIDARLFHARFAMGDRLAIEAEVRGRFGKSSTDRAGVVVGTQVMEQSLDLDFDLMVTDLAPIDLLLQRAGRLWRHARETRPLPAPALHVLSPPPEDDPGPDWLGPARRRTGVVYPHHALLWRTARALFSAQELALPDDLRRLIEEVYAADAEVPKGLERATGQAEAREFVNRAHAGQNLLEWDRGYKLDCGAWASDIATPTRLGEPTLTFRLARWQDGMLRPWCEHPDPARSWALSEITLPMRRASGVPPASGELSSAVALAKQSWARWERELPLLPLSPVTIGWQGTVLDRGNVPVTVQYSAAGGLTIPSTK